MHRRHSANVGILLGVSVVLSLSCSGKDPFSPGTKLGTFHVAAKLVSTTCGATPDPWEFDVRLNHEGTMLYWIQGGAPLQGRVDATAKTTIETESVFEVRAADAKRALCSVARKDALDMSLSGADGALTRDPSLTTSFKGGLVYSFTPTEGSICTDQLTAAGGDFDALPCVVTYEVVGAFRSPPD